MLPQVQETAINITRTDIPAFVLIQHGVHVILVKCCKVLGAEILFNIGHANKLETFPGEQIMLS